MASLGIYFGHNVINLVETKGKKLINNIQIPCLKISGPDLEERVPFEIKIVALLKDELRRNKIETKETSICLSGKDLIIRVFEMPLMSQSDLRTAINFEAKKYIPFKIEDLIADYQWYTDKLNRRNLVVFTGIKKADMDTYFSISGQLNIKVQKIEYSGYSILRFLKLVGLEDKGVSAVISVDLQEEEEVIFMAQEAGFPLFSRDITLGAGPAAGIPQIKKELDKDVILGKVRSEVRISLDYYNRKFPTKNIKKIYLVSNKDSFLELEGFVKDMGFSAQFVDVNKYIAKFAGKSVPFSLGFIKSYSSSLSKLVKTTLKTDFLTTKKKAASPEESWKRREASGLFADLRPNALVVVAALLIFIFPFAFGIYQKIPLEKELGSIIAKRPSVSGVSQDLVREELANINSNYKDKIKIVDELLKKQLYITEFLNVIPQVMPNGMWLDEFSFRKVGEITEIETELTLRGTAYMADGAKEFELVNIFISRLKENSTFRKYFKTINLLSIDQVKVQNSSVTNFMISCRI